MGFGLIVIILLTVIQGCAMNPPAPAPKPVAAPPPPEVPKQLPSILFDSGAAELSPVQRQQIRDLAVILKQSHVVDLPVLVQGHSDRIGRRAVKAKVSKFRAQTVANELIFNGISPERISVEGFGDSRPAASTAEGVDDAQIRALNRRVDVVIQRSRG